MIRLENVRSRDAGDFQLEIPSLSIGPGLTLVTGRNGAGKSTLLRLLATAEEPESGRIVYREGTLAEALPRIRATLGYLPAELELYDHMTPSQFVRYMAELKGIEDPAHERLMLEELGLADVGSRRIAGLSQGQRQRTGIAQALLGFPDYLLLDEPLEGLDAMHRNRLARLLDGYAASRSVIVTTHELAAWQHADTILLLEEGRLLFAGSAYEWLRTAPLAVWSGLLPENEAHSLPEDAVLARKREDGQWRVRLAAEHPPAPGWQEESVTLEDAYQIRMLQRRRAAAG
ncbi:ABC transporter ATP-binding protein [Paenibacillus sp. J31TS4]|uniref:ATP-binding cassette domain-containing protein n=1 Tax=Paenibacillus sp. J31TS4 TaxID=2807195 RepID=UPI001B256631|nr:ATP-binding cassette domain-containing protein [Paenibacillus sp. J31TS4]GIP36945.1 ABC transporter ATP-binding protein [Paenibacillus sp. J31TS4]